MADPLLDLAMSAIYSYMSFDKAKELVRVYAAAPEPESIALDIKLQAGGKDKGPLETSVSAGALTEPAVQKIFESRGGIALKGLTPDDAYAIVIAYMGLGGLLWALWGIYKMALGESFGDYTLKMYRYFKDSYKILRKLEKF